MTSTQENSSKQDRNTTVQFGEEDFRHMIENIDAGVGIMDFQENFVFSNMFADEVFGVKPGELIHRNLREFVTKEKFAEVKKETHLRQQGRSSVYNLPIIRPDGDTRQLMVNAIPWENQQTGFKGSFATFRDITDLKQAQITLQRFKTVIDKAQFGVVLGHWGGQIEYVNEFFAQLHGYTPDELTGKNISLFHTEEQMLHIDLIARTLREKGAFTAKEVWHKRRDGSVFPTTMSGNVVIDEETKQSIIFTTAIDISRHKQMEESLQKTQRLESVSMLAGGIAHDFNNILMAILGNVTVVKHVLDQKDRVIETLDKVEKVVLQACHLTKQLQAFSKDGSPQKTVVSLEELLVNNVMFALSGSNVKCDFSLPQGLWFIDADEGQMTQVINNLVINAAQSMPDGGMIKIEAENVNIIDGERMYLLKPGRYVKLSLKDSGTGIHTDDLGRIFDPYYTTKENGSGLGLSISFNIIRKHGGTIEVESQKGIGSTFSVFIPAARDFSVDLPRAAENLRVGDERLLIMDDDLSVRDAMSEIVRTLGYSVDSCQNGEEAIELYRTALNSDHPYNALILDLTVRGGMGGCEALQKIREFDPAVKAIISSGYSSDVLIQDYQSYGFKHAILKPYTLEDLSRVIHEVLTV
jgi:PAS domain S-box-containing protein